MDGRTEIREFLASRRARITPEQAGLPAYGGRRRVKGLRREEVAMLADVSFDYYVRLERGNLAGASDVVLNGVARALNLDDAERRYLHDLARHSPAPVIAPAPTPTPTARRVAPAEHLRPALQHVVDAIGGAPAWIHNHRQDVLGANRLARVLYAPFLADPSGPANIARFIYLDPAARAFLPDWGGAADDVAALLRGAAGRHPHDEELSDLIAQLSSRSEDFRTRWADHNVRQRRTGPKKLHHPTVGDLEVNFETMSLDSDPGLTLVIYTALPGTPSADALHFLSARAAGHGRPEPGLGGRPT